ncbi:phosphodiesterase [Marinobacter fonticola]|uniref:phosphodiesterase n=1 Tax=Marinobacter fonticola TaxID=2603215 RepID=UPI001D0D8454|nr:phosphodiesterase [Marinobacter fonticola]
MKTQKKAENRTLRPSFFQRMGCALLMGGLMMTGAWSVHADELRTPVMQQGAERDSVSLPRHGQTQDQVRTSFGQPQGIKGPVGQPPITQWLYNDFVVYFEYDHVVHAVMKPESR